MDLRYIIFMIIIYITIELFQINSILTGTFIGIAVMNFFLHTFESSVLSLLLFLIIWLILSKKIRIYSYKNNMIKILFASRLVEEKWVDILIDAIEIIQKMRNSKIKLYGTYVRIENMKISANLFEKNMEHMCIIMEKFDLGNLQNSIEMLISFLCHQDFSKHFD